MATTLARTFVSSLSNRSLNTVPASAPALKRFYSVATSNNKEEEQKQRSAGGLLNRSQINGIYIFFNNKKKPNHVENKKPLIPYHLIQK